MGNNHTISNLCGVLAGFIGLAGMLFLASNRDGFSLSHHHLSRESQASSRRETPRDKYLSFSNQLVKINSEISSLRTRNDFGNTNSGTYKRYHELYGGRMVLMEEYDAQLLSERLSKQHH